uniref:Uncharacterized protein n=1 Tax=Clytia hemisphaerica TaxID=252671 RepID=A0A7M5WSF6_9CNID
MSRIVLKSPALFPLKVFLKFKDKNKIKIFSQKMPENQTKEETHFETIRISVLPSGNAQILPDDSSLEEKHDADVTHNISVLTSDDSTNIPGCEKEEDYTDLVTDQNHNNVDEKTIINGDHDQNSLQTETIENIQNESQTGENTETVETVDPKQRLADIDKRVEDINDKLKDLQEELSKGRLEKPLAEKLGRPLQKLRTKLRDEKRKLLGIEKLDDDDKLCDDVGDN